MHAFNWSQMRDHSLGCVDSCTREGVLCLLELLTVKEDALELFKAEAAITIRIMQ